MDDKSKPTNEYIPIICNDININSNVIRRPDINTIDVTVCS